MSTVIVAIMAVFMVVGALDRALFNNKFGYGEEFEKGFNTLGPMAICMIGIMCFAPVLGDLLSPLLAPVFRLFGVDPGMIGGMFLACDMGGYPLSEALCDSHDAAVLSGMFMGATIGSAVSFNIPVSMTLCDKEDHPHICRGMVAALIASPMCGIIGGLLCGMNLLFILQNLAPALLIAVVLALLLTFRRKMIVKVFTRLARGITGLFTLMLVVSVLETLFDLTIIPGLAPFDEQMVLVGGIGVTLAGAYPFVKFIGKVFGRGLDALGRLLKADRATATGMVASLANPLPLFAMIKDMSPRGKALAIAFAAPATTCVGDHLAYVAAIDPELVAPMVISKLATGLLALFIALLLDRGTKKHDA